MTTQNINLNIKSNLAKLLATENITVQHNNVKTASFDVKNRVLTLPIFTNQSGDVYDMLIAHECSHALYTPYEKWEKVVHDEELKSYVNVLEDTRIDKLIQKKFPGVVKNYLNGFDILNKQNFFGLKEIKDLQKGLMLIDKINLRSKSMDRMSFDFNSEEQQWIKKVDSLKSFAQVVKLAKEMIDWQKKQVEQQQKLPQFDEMMSNYSDDNQQEQNKEQQEQEQQSGQSNDDDQEQTQNQQEENDGEEENGSTSSDEEKINEEEEVQKTETETVTNGAGGNFKLKSVTNKNYEQNVQSLVDTKHKGFEYVTLPEPNLKNIIVNYKEYINDFRKHIQEHTGYSSSVTKYEYLSKLKQKYKEFQNDNKKTVQYLVKEFEMKKAATSYQRASVDKTGVLDPLKLKDYKFSDDLFKRLSIIPDAKNHGMMMLLDWSGSMADCLYQTVEQLINLVYFCQKVNIPYEVYFFSSDNKSIFSNTSQNDGKKNFNYKIGDIFQQPFKLVNIASHKMKKTELDEAMLYMFHMAVEYDYSYRRKPDYDSFSWRMGSFYIPRKYQLGSTPLNEALTVCHKLVPMFKAKYRIEKMTFITLTDGAGNGNSDIISDENFQSTDRWERNYVKSNVLVRSKSFDKQMVIKDKNKYYHVEKRNAYQSEELTGTLLNILKEKYDVSIIGFYVLKLRRYDMGRYFSTIWSDSTKEKQKTENRKKQFNKENVCEYPQTGYNKYFLLNGKKMSVENTDLSGINDTMKAGKIKQMFSKSMKGRLVSRVLLNKFIEEVA